MSRDKNKIDTSCQINLSTWWDKDKHQDGAIYQFKAANNPLLR